MFIDRMRHPHRSSTLVVIVLFVLLSKLPGVVSFLVQYNGAVLHTGSFREHFFGAVPKSTDSALDGTEINIDLNIRRGPEQIPGNLTLELIVLKGPGILSFPGPTQQHPGVLSFCCSPELLNVGACEGLNGLIVPQEQVELFRQKITVFADHDHTNVRKRFSVDDPNGYSLLISNCDTTQFAPVLIFGKVSIMSPDVGHLPLHLQNLSRFYFLSSFAAGFVVLLIMISFFVFRRSLTFFHLVVLLEALAMTVEFMLWDHYLHKFNTHGVPDPFLKSLANIIAILRRSAVFTSLAIVVSGFGLSSAFQLEQLTELDRKYIGMFGLLYTFAQMLAWWNLSDASFIQQYDISLFLPSLFIDMVSIWVLLHPAIRTKSMLERSRPQMPAASVFRLTLWFLVIISTILVVVAGISVHFAENRGSIFHWRVVFLFPEAILQWVHVTLVVLLTLATYPIAARLHQVLPVRHRPLARPAAIGLRQNEDELAPLGSNSHNPESPYLNG